MSDVTFFLASTFADVRIRTDVLAERLTRCWRKKRKQENGHSKEMGIDPLKLLSCKSNFENKVCIE